MTLIKMPFTFTKDVLRRAQGQCPPQPPNADVATVERRPLPKTEWPPTVEPAAFATSATAILSAELSSISSRVAYLPHCTERGRGLCCPPDAAFSAGEVIFVEPAFAWSFYLNAKSDRELLERTIASPSLSLGGVLSRFLCLFPNDRYLPAMAQTRGPASTAAGGGQQWVSAFPSGTGVTLSAQALVCPAIHKSGFQTRLPELTWATTTIPGPGQEVQLMCLLASLTNHSCEPNVAHEPVWIPDSVLSAHGPLPASPDAVPVPREGVQLVPGLAFRALRAIQGGEELCHAYVDPDADVEDRQCRLQAGYGFVCTCPKCTAQSTASKRQD